MRIGLFGGTFNPIHLGHLRSGEEIRESFGLQQVVFIPSAVPPHKEGKDILSPFHRMEMVNLAIKGNRGFSASDIELKRHGKSYSLETIHTISTMYGSKLTLFFIMGIDAFAEISAWKNYMELFSRCNIVVTTRPGHDCMGLDTILPTEARKNFSYIPEEDRFEHTSNFSLFFREITPLDISSRIIRKRIKENRSVRYLLHEKVVEYIHLQGLYKDS